LTPNIAVHSLLIDSSSPAQVSSPISDLNGQLSSGESFFKLVSTILIPFEKIPYVGPVLKALRLRPLSKQVSKGCKNGSRGIDKLEKTAEGTIAPIGAFGNAIDELNDNLGTSMQILGGLVEYITRASFCALVDGLNDEFDRLQEWIERLLASVNIANVFVINLEDYLSALNDFSNFMNRNVFGVFRKFDGILNALGSIISALSFIRVRNVDFAVCFECWLLQAVSHWRLFHRYWRPSLFRFHGPVSTGFSSV
jgi:hypothetical protein